MREELLAMLKPLTPTVTSEGHPRASKLTAEAGIQATTARRRGMEQVYSMAHDRLHRLNGTRRLRKKYRFG